MEFFENAGDDVAYPERMLSYFHRYTLRVDTYFFENVEKKQQNTCGRGLKRFKVCVKSVLK